MADLAVSTPTIDGFFRRWEVSGTAEPANYSMFLNELCDLLDVPRPDPAGPDDEKNTYVFESGREGATHFLAPRKRGRPLLPPRATSRRPQRASGNSQPSSAGYRLSPAAELP